MHNVTDWNVIVVDDEPHNIGVVKLVLEFQQATVRTADSAAECLRLLGEELPTLLLIDLQMPEASGYDLLEILRQHPTWKTIPAIAVTARAMRDDEEQVLAAGFDGYIPKPINAQTFVDEVMLFLKK